MHQLFQQHNLFLVKEHVGLFKAASNYDIFDPQSGNLLMTCREEKLGPILKLLRFTDYKRMTPFESIVRDADGQQVLRVHRGWTLFLSRVSVRDDRDEIVGGFKQKFFSIGGAFRVLDAQDQEVCSLKGNWIGWEFSFEYEGIQLAKVTKKWAGLGKELFTSADTYILQIAETVPPEHPVRQLILGSVLCIDLVLKE